MASDLPIQSPKIENRNGQFDLVRRFSQRAMDELPENNMGPHLALAERFRQKSEEETPLEKLLLADGTKTSKPAITLLDIEMEQMAAAWRKLQSNLSKEDKKLLKNRKPDYNSVREAIDSFTARQLKKEDSELAKAKGYFSQFCKTMDAYSGLLAFIPSDDKYVSVFCGALTTIVQASVNHGKIAEGFSSALVRIGREMTYWRDQLSTFSQGRDPSSVSNCNGLLKLVAQLYTKVFQFLNYYLSWYQSRRERIFSSVNKNYAEDKVKAPLDELLSLSSNLRRAASVQGDKVLLNIEGRSIQAVDLSSENLVASRDMQEQVRELREYLEDSRMEMRSGLRRLDKAADIQDTLVDVTYRVIAGLHGQGLLEANSEDAAFRKTTGNVSMPPKVFEAKVFETSRPEIEDIKESSDYTFETLERLAQSTGESYSGFSPKAARSSHNTASKVFISLQEWLSAPESRSLWIYGPSNTSIPSNLSSNAAYVVSTINEMKIPLMAFCYQFGKSQMESLIDMIYSLVQQLVWLVPDRFSSDKNLGADRWENLDKSVQSLPKIMVLMEDLLTVVPKLLFCVIDGIHMIDDESDDEYATGGYISFLLTILRQSQEEKVLKTLFTTDGYCRRLFQELAPKDKVDAMSEMQDFEPGPLEGRMVVGGLTFPESDVNFS